jgi:hypothetical protein
MKLSETSETCGTGATSEDETFNPSRFSRESRATNEIRFTDLRRLLMADGQANDRAFFPAGPALRPIRKRQAE